LSGFGLVSIVPGKNYVAQEKVYAVAWTAPEILEGADKITRGVDVFAFGMVVIEVGPHPRHPWYWRCVCVGGLSDIRMLPKVFVGKHLFSELTTPVVISRIVDGERPVRPQGAQELGLTDSMWEIAVHCWRKDPAQRPTVARVVELLREPLLSSLEADLSDLLQAYKTWDEDVQGKRAQELADRLDGVRHTERRDIRSLHHVSRFLTIHIFTSTSANNI